MTLFDVIRFLVEAKDKAEFCLWIVDLGVLDMHRNKVRKFGNGASCETDKPQPLRARKVSINTFTASFLYFMYFYNKL